MAVKSRTLPYLTQSDLDRFWSKVDIRGEDECWHWLGSCWDAGYGQFSKDHKLYGAHVVSHAIAHGENSVGTLVRHSCHNPPCVNPKHLSSGTTSQNMIDSQSAGRLATGKRNGKYTKPEATPIGEKHGMAKLNTDKVIEIRRMIAAGMTDIEIAPSFGVDRVNIYMIRKGKTWRHVLQ